MNYTILWTARWTRKLLDFLFWIWLRDASQGCRNLLRTSARKGATGTEPRIRTVRQLAAAAGDGSLGFAGSPGQLETSLNSGYTVGPCNSYLEGPTPICLGLLLAHRALSSCRRRRRSPRKERLGSLLLRTAARAIADARSRFLRTAARDLPTLAAHVPVRLRPARDLPTLAAHVASSLSDAGARFYRRSQPTWHLLFGATARAYDARSRFLAAARGRDCRH